MHIPASLLFFFYFFFFFLATAEELTPSSSLPSKYPYPTTSPEELLTLHHHHPPSSSPIRSIAPRVRRPLAIYVCNHDFYRGNCWLAPANGRACQNWDNIRSFGPDNGLACDLFEGENCRGSMALKFVTYPGVEQTPRSGLRSWRCGSRG